MRPGIGRGDQMLGSRLIVIPHARQRTDRATVSDQRWPIHLRHSRWWLAEVLGPKWVRATRRWNDHEFANDPSRSGRVVIDVPVAQRLSAIWGSSPSDVWAVGDNNNKGAMVHWTGGAMHANLVIHCGARGPLQAHPRMGKWSGRRLGCRLLWPSQPLYGDSYPLRW